jgi:WD40 repeat protein
MNELAAELPAAGVVRVVGPEEAGAGFLASASGLIVTCAHVVAGCVPGATVGIEPHVARGSFSAAVDLLQDPPDVAVLRLAAPVPPEMLVLPLGRSPRTSQPGLRTFGYPHVRAEAGLPGDVAFLGVTAADGYDQLALRSEQATLGFSGAPIWDPELGAVVGMVKSIARGDPGQRLGTTVIGVPAETIRDLCPELQLPTGCPYRGLEPFTEEHVEYYYGREHAISQLLTSLAARDFVPVVAVSGGGKSSLLQAGLGKGLRDRPVVGLAQRIRCYQRVSGQPHAELLHSLAQHEVLLPPELAAAPAQELAAAIRAACPRAELMVVVDQFERLYTDCEDAERKRFVQLLRLLATGTVKVVIGLRADFYHLALADLGEQLVAGQVALAPMSEQDLDQAIAAPAAKLLRSLQPGLAQRLIADVRGRPGDLPLLQFALTELWERDAAGGVMTEETYQDLGVDLPDGTRLPGAQGALIRRAEQLWQDLGPDDRLRLQRILLGLIAAQPAETGTASLVAGARDLSRPARLAQWDEEDQRLIQRLIDARLLTADKAPAGGRPTVEVSHEALLRAWPRLRNWLGERSQFVQWRAQDLAPNLERWLDSNKNPEFLLPRSLLEPALRWFRDYPDELAGPPAGYIQASRRRSTRRRGLLIGAVAVLVGVSSAAAGVSNHYRQAANQQRDKAISAEVAARSEQLASTDPATAAFLAAAASRIAPSGQAQESMLQVLAQPERAVLADGTDPAETVAFSPDGRVLAAGTGSYVGGAVLLWDVTTGRRIGKTITGKEDHNASEVAFSPDGTMLATGSLDGAVRLWDVATQNPIGRSIPVSPGGSIAGVAFVPGGKILITGNANGTVRLWDVATQRPIGRPILVNGGINCLAVSPDGKTLVTADGSGGLAQLWDISTQRPIGSAIGPGGDSASSPHRVKAVAFSPDSNLLATVDYQGKVTVWNTHTRQQVGRSFGLPATGNVPDLISGLDFSPDGNILATFEDDDTVRLWDVATGLQLGAPITTGDHINAVAFSPDGSLLATADEGGVGAVRLWDPYVYRPLGASVSTGSDTPLVAMAFSKDGKIFATADGEGSVRLWNAATLQPIGQPMVGHHFATPCAMVGSYVPGACPVDGVAIRPDGKLLTVWNQYGDVRLWSMATQRPIGRMMHASGGAYGVAFSPDGNMLLIGGNNRAQLWNVRTQQPIGKPMVAGRLASFSPDGQVVAAINARGTSAQLWNVRTQRPIGKPIVAGSVIEDVVFNPAGTMLATADLDGTARLWSVATQSQTGASMTASTTSSGVASISPSARAVTFSPDGTLLATTGSDGTARLWDAATQRQIGPPMTAPRGISPVAGIGPVAFSTDGQTLAIGDDQMASVWNIAFPGNLNRAVCSIANPSLPRQVWDTYIQSLPYQRVCP